MEQLENSKTKRVTTWVKTVTLSKKLMREEEENQNQSNPGQQNSSPEGPFLNLTAPARYLDNQDSFSQLLNFQTREENQPPVNTEVVLEQILAVQKFPFENLAVENCPKNFSLEIAQKSRDDSKSANSLEFSSIAHL